MFLTPSRFCNFFFNCQLYENWYKGQPDSYFLSGEDCAVMVWHDSGRWRDVPCNYHLSYTCKKGICQFTLSPSKNQHFLGSHLKYWKKKNIYIFLVFHHAASCGPPPAVPNAKLFGKKRQRYETNTKLRYYCLEGFVQKLDPVIRCLPGGQWEQPQVTCRPGKLSN